MPIYLISQLASSDSVDQTFFGRNITYLLLILLFGIATLFFLVCVHVINPGEDSSVNSCCGLCFIFSPLLCFIVAALALVTEQRNSAATQILRLLNLGYAIVLVSCVVETVIVCSLVGTTRKNDSAYQGLVDRELW